LLAAILSATGEKNPGLAWAPEYAGLLNVLDIAREEKLQKVYWPSSIAVSDHFSQTKLPAANHYRTYHGVWDQ